VVTLVVPNRTWSDFMYDEHAAGLTGLAMFYGDDFEVGIGKLPWHFICLQDLGIDVKFSASPASFPGG